MTGGMSLNVQQVKSLLTDFLNKVTLITYKMVGTEPIARLAFCVAIILIIPCCHVDAAVEVTAVNIFEPLYLAARDTTDVAIRHSVTEAYVK